MSSGECGLLRASPRPSDDAHQAKSLPKKIGRFAI
jgi:hypothetical protein